MNDLEQEERMVLGRARRALSPSPEQVQRVLQATLRATSEAPSSEQPSLESPAGQELGASLSVRSIGKLLAAVALAGVSGVYGYRMGFEAGRSSTSPATAARLESHAEAMLPVAPDEARPASAATEAPELGAVPRPRKSAVEVAKSTASRELSLAEELGVLKRVERALREGEPGTALELLDDLEQRRPVTVLAEERLAATVMARCALGLGSHARLVQEFVRSRPDSVYLSRVRRACDEP